MKNLRIGVTACILVLLSLFALLAAETVAAEGAVEYPDRLPKLQGPVVITTMGQSPGGLMVKMCCTAVKLPCVEQPLLTADALNALAKRQDAPKVLVITMGTSLKGMGSAGIDIEVERKRVQAVIDAAHKLGMKIIGTQIEGPARRVDETDEKSIRTVTPQSDILVIRKDVNGDGYFTKTAKEKGAPLIFITQALDFQQVLKTLFGL